MSARHRPIAPKRAALLASLDQALRKVGAQSVMISDAVARRVGLHPTTLECLDLLLMAGPTTAGALAERTGLTTGATTAVIDRLERAGLVRRHRVQDDRRCVLVEALPAKVRRIQTLYKPLAAEMTRVNGEFDDQELSTVVAYLNRALDACAPHVNRLRGRDEPRRTARPAARRPRREVKSSRPTIQRTGRAR
jgi:DNA-binding MarR family transcriptional regulator